MLTSCDVQPCSISQISVLDMQAGVIDEDVAGLVVGLFGVDDPEHEQLHLAVRTQVFSTTSDWVMGASYVRGKTG